MVQIVKRTKIWFTISLSIIVLGMGFLCFRGLNFGIDFTGGTILNINMNKQISNEDKKQMDELLVKYTKKYSLREVNNKKEFEIIIQSGALEDAKINEVKTKIKTDFKLGDKYLLSEDNIKGSVGKELTKNAWMALFSAAIVMLIYIGIRFEIDFGVAAMVALVHDILITISVYAILGIKVNSPFIAAILTIVGYSINDTIVIFDRIRENKKKLGKIKVEELVDISINQTMKRSIYTSLSTLITIIALVILVPSIREFTVPLIIGISVGTCSSIFIASPVWAIIKKLKIKKGKA